MGSQLQALDGSPRRRGDTGNAQQALDQLAIQGVSFFTASGDEGAGSAIWQNLTMNHQTLVGGTVLSTNPLGPGGSYPDPYYAGEGAWPSSGGGVLDAPIPDYQLAIMQADAATNGGSTTARNFPDVATPAQDIEFFTSGAAAVGAGTSFATPLWAGFTALINQMSVANNAGLMGFLNPTLYDIGLTQADTGNANLYAQCFNDIDDGTSNGKFKAVPGYDLVTGLGSPKPELIFQLGSATPTTPAQFQLIRFIVGTGGDNLRDDSTATADVFLKNGGVFTVTLKEKGDGSWGNRAGAAVGEPGLQRRRAELADLRDGASLWLLRRGRAGRPQAGGRSCPPLLPRREAGEHPGFR